jgi:hypothetical protein
MVVTLFYELVERFRRVEVSLSPHLSKTTIRSVEMRLYTLQTSLKINGSQLLFLDLYWYTS